MVESRLVSENPKSFFFYDKIWAFWKENEGKKANKVCKSCFISIGK